MSKSDPSPAGRIELHDSPSEIRKKIRRAVTDSGSEVRYDVDNKPAISNLLTIYSLMSGRSIPEIEEQYAGKGYGAFKGELADLVVDQLGPLQQRLRELTEAPTEVVRILGEGAEQARTMASAKMERVRELVGVGLPKF